MKYLGAAILLSLYGGLTHAGVIFPDETSTRGLPYAIPCTERVAPNTKIKYLACDWYGFPRKVNIWDKNQNSYVTYNNLVSGECINGTCKTEHGTFGHWGRDTRFMLSIWYYIAESTDGAPIAYLTGNGPEFGGKSVSYLEAAKLLDLVYKDSGVTPDDRKKLIEPRYFGGWAKFAKDAKVDEGKANVVIDTSKITQAFCSQDLDDSCTVNDAPVRKADLGKYFPVVDMVEVQADGGYCEYPICYDADDKPIGIANP